MADDFPRDSSWDDDDDYLPGSAFYEPGGAAGEEPSLDAFDIFTTADDSEDSVNESGTIDPSSSENGRELLTLLFTVTNPAGTVSATTLIDGRVHEIKLSGGANRLTESELAEEILEMATLARRKAQAAQHALVVESISALGHDPALARAFLERRLGIPSPETVQHEMSQVFSAHYGGNYE